MSIEPRVFTYFSSSSCSKVTTMSNTQAATDGNISKVQGKIDSKLNAIDLLIKDADTLKKEGIKKVSLNWFISWTSDSFANIKTISKASKTYEENKSNIIKKLERLDAAVKLLDSSDSNSDEPDYEALYREYKFRNEALTYDLGEEVKVQQFLKDELQRKNAVIRDKDEALDKANKQIAELKKKLESPRPTITVVK